MSMPSTAEWLLLIAGGGLTLLAGGVFLTVFLLSRSGAKKRDQQDGKDESS